MPIDYNVEAWGYTGVSEQKMPGRQATAAAAPTLDISAVRAALAKQQLDGWLLYDFHGLNPIAADVTGVGSQGGHLATRRWYYLIRADGEPRKLVHAIEPESLAHLPGTTERYAGREQLEAGLASLLTGIRRVAMEYSPGCAIPYIARVDAGTIELVRQLNVEVMSSGDLVQRFSAVWNDAEIATHRAASEKLYRIKDRAFEAIAQRLGGGGQTNEFEIQQLMVVVVCRGRSDQRFTRERVRRRERRQSALPADGRVDRRQIRPDELVLLDLWGKLDRLGAVFADITWVGTRARGSPSDSPGVCRSPRREGRRGRLRAAEGAQRPRGAGLGSRSCRRHCIETGRLWRQHPSPDRP